MKNLTDIIQKLSATSSSPEDRKHYELVMEALLANRYNDIVVLVNQKLKQGLIKSPYQIELAELLPHFTIKSDEDAELRLQQLLFAIQSGSDCEAKVRKALTTGSAIVINDAYSGEERYPWARGMVPLMVAIGEKNVAVIKLLLDHGATLVNAKNALSPFLEAIRGKDVNVINLFLDRGATLASVADINAPLNFRGETLLHIACLLNIPSLTAMVLNKKPDIEAIDHRGATPLHHACLKNNTIVAMQLIDLGAKMDAIDEARGTLTTPFSLAINNKNIGLMQYMQQKGYRVSPLDLDIAKYESMDIYRILKAPFKEKKREIIRGGNASTLFHAQHPLRPLLRSLYIEDQALRAETRKNMIDIYDDKNPIMKPLLSLISFAAAQNPNGDEFGKKLKIVIADNVHVGELVASGEQSGGMYKNKNSIYVAGRISTKEQAMARTLHELKHFADKMIYKNLDVPFRVDTQRDHFYQVKESLRQHVDEFKQHKRNGASKEDRVIYGSIETIFKLYAPLKQDAEVMVKVPEIIGYLGVAKGYDWLKKNEPLMLAFYEKHFNPACEAYLREQSLKVASVDTNKPKF